MAQDRRIRKTKTAIDKACWELLQEQDFETITVGDIAQRADINRATFYRYHVDKYHWLEQQIDVLLDELFALSDFINTTSDEAVILAGFSRVYQHYNDHYDTYAVLFSKNVGILFQNRFAQRIAQSLRTILSAGEEPSAELEFEVQFTASSIAGTLKWWIENDRPLSPERMAQRMVQLYDCLPWYQKT